MKKLLFLVSALLLLSFSTIYAGTPIVTENGDTYMSPVDNDPSDANVVRAVDQKYGITFESKRKFKTNHGNFSLNYAQFKDIENHYKFELNLSCLTEKNANMRPVLKMFDKNGTMVDVMDFWLPAYDKEIGQTTLNWSMTYAIKNDNYKNIARIEFAINAVGVDPMVYAHSFVDVQIIGDSGRYPDVLSFFLDPTVNYTDEQRAQRIASYNESLAEAANDFQARLAQVADIVEIQ